MLRRDTGLGPRKLCHWSVSCLNMSYVSLQNFPGVHLLLEAPNIGSYPWLTPEVRVLRTHLLSTSLQASASLRDIGICRYLCCYICFLSSIIFGGPHWTLRKHANTLGQSSQQSYVLGVPFLEGQNDGCSAVTSQGATALSVVPTPQWTLCWSW